MSEPRTDAGRRLAKLSYDNDPWYVEQIVRVEAEATSGGVTTEGLRDIILNGGLRLPSFDHWRERESSKPSDPDDIRWDCVCGYSGSPQKVQRHWAALLPTTPPAPDTPPGTTAGEGA